MQSLLKSMNCDPQGLWNTRLAQDLLLVSGLFASGMCTYLIFNDSLHHPHICEYFCRKPFISFVSEVFMECKLYMCMLNDSGSRYSRSIVCKQLYDLEEMTTL